MKVDQLGLFVSFEGADILNKSNVARLVFERLRKDYSKSLYVEKNHPVMSSGYAAYHLAKIREILWEYDDDAPLDKLGDQHWLHLLASWFHAVDFGVVAPALSAGNLVIANSWFYKYRSRFALKANHFPSDSQHAFERLREPDFVILLDIDPQVALRRRGRALKSSESGVLDGAKGAKEDSFVSYQNRVRDNLMANINENWHVINMTNMTVESIVDESVSLIEEIIGKRNLNISSNMIANVV